MCFIWGTIAEASYTWIISVPYSWKYWRELNLAVKPKIAIRIFVTCSEKRDHSGYFIKIEFLAWIDSFVCAESNGASFMKKYQSQVELWPFLHTQVDIFVFRKMHIFNQILYVSKQLFAPKHYDSLQQLHKHSISIWN